MPPRSRMLNCRGHSSLCYYFTLSRWEGYSRSVRSRTSRPAAWPARRNQPMEKLAKAARDPSGADKSGNKIVSQDVQRLVESSRLAGTGGGKNQSGNVAQEGSSEAGKSYVVQKGDSPAGIAKKFKVSYARPIKGKQHRRSQKIADWTEVSNPMN